MIEIIAITELINAGEFDTEMIEAKIQVTKISTTLLCSGSIARMFS